MSDQDAELKANAIAWGMTTEALAKLLECGRGRLEGLDTDPDNHHLRFDGKKIYMRVRINRQNIEEKLSSDLAKARLQRDKRLRELGFNLTLFFRNQSAYNARKSKR